MIKIENWGSCKKEISQDNESIRIEISLSEKTISKLEELFLKILEEICKKEKNVL
jgi:hypothetical protein